MIGPELIFVVLVAAIVMALSPSTFNVLIQLCAAILGAGKSTRRVFWLGAAFIGSLLATSFIIGLVALYGASLLPTVSGSYIAIGLGILIVNAGLIEIKDYFWYGRGFGLRIHTRAARRIKKLTKGRISTGRALVLGSYTAFVALPSTGPAYVAVIMLLRNNFDSAGLLLLLLYNAIFVAPLFCLLLLVVYGVKLSTFRRWKEDGKGRMRLGMGLLLIMLGWIMLLISNGVLNLR